MLKAEGTAKCYQCIVDRSEGSGSRILGERGERLDGDLGPTTGSIAEISQESVEGTGRWTRQASRASSRNHGALASAKPSTLLHDVSRNGTTGARTSSRGLSFRAAGRPSHFLTRPCRRLRSPEVRARDRKGHWIGREQRFRHGRATLRPRSDYPRPGLS